MQARVVEAAQDGDQEAFTELMIEFGDRLYGVARRILRDASLADEAAQVTWITAWGELPRLRDPLRFEAWIYRILVTASYRVYRAEHRPTRLHVVPSPQPDHQSEVADREALERAFSRLSIDHRAAVVLHHYRGLPLPEVAAILHIPVGTARTRWFHALRALRAGLEADARSPASGRPA